VLPGSRAAGSRGAVLVADHAAQAGACRCKVGLEFGDAGLQGLAVVYGLAGLAGELLDVAGQLANPGCEVPGADRVELLAELAADAIAELVALSAQVPDLLAGQFRPSPGAGG
jgi:hypothetical protein